MYRIDHVTKQADKFGAGKDGYTEGNPSAKPTATPRSIVTADALNAIQEELANAIEAGGAALDKTDNAQLAALIVGGSYAPTVASTDGTITKPVVYAARFGAHQSIAYSFTIKVGTAGPCLITIDTTPNPLLTGATGSKSISVAQATPKGGATASAQARAEAKADGSVHITTDSLAGGATWIISGLLVYPLS